MNATEAGREPTGYELKSDLAKFCLPAAKRDANRKLAWVNSICILFLLIGLLGAKRADTRIKPLPVMEEAIPALIEPPPPPPRAAENQKPQETEPDKPDVPRLVVVVPDAPNISFSVPTIGNVLAPAALAKPPPLNPMQPVAPLQNVPVSLNTTGAGGERPDPPYPKMAMQAGMQGTVTLTMTVDDSGVITDIAVKESSGYPLLDRSTIEYVRRRWTVKPGAGNHLYECSITYRLQAN